MGTSQAALGAPFGIAPAHELATRPDDYGRKTKGAQPRQRQSTDGMRGRKSRRDRRQQPEGNEQHDETLVAETAERSKVPAVRVLRILPGLRRLLGLRQRMPVQVNGGTTRMKITITGIDHWFDAADLAKLDKLEPTVEVEFAVLFGTKTGKEARYPGREVVEGFVAFCKRRGIRSALHLCGNAGREAVSENCSKDLTELAMKFNRVQINGCEHNVAGAVRFRNTTGTMVIMQVRYDFRREPDPAVLQYLYERDGGPGVEAFMEWPTANCMPCGYAGGINPDNVETAIRRATLLGGHWIDTGRGVRTEDRLDKTKIRELIRAAARVAAAQKSRFEGAAEARAMAAAAEQNQRQDGAGRIEP